MDHPPFRHPTHCFCQVSSEKLAYWAEKRYREGRPTSELLASTTDPDGREVICIVALLDVDEETLLKSMGDVNLPEHHILHCRGETRRILGMDP